MADGGFNESLRYSSSYGTEVQRVSFVGSTNQDCHAHPLCNLQNLLGSGVKYWDTQGGSEVCAKGKTRANLFPWLLLQSCSKTTFKVKKVLKTTRIPREKRKQLWEMTGSVDNTSN